MSYQRIQAFSTATRSVPYICKERFTPRPDLKWQWLQKVIFSLLRRMGCFSQETELVVTRHLIDTDEFMKALCQQHMEVLSQYARYDTPCRLLIGPQQFDALHGTAGDINSPITFYGEYRTRHTIRGMKVTIVPWMDGMLVLPDQL